MIENNLHVLSIVREEGFLTIHVYGPTAFPQKSLTAEINFREVEQRFAWAGI
jgi:hypothetical protein